MARVAVVVSPGAPRSELVGRHGDAWKVRIAAPPARGRANAELIALLAAILEVPRDHLAVVAGAASRRKTIDVADLDAEEINRRLEASP